MKKIILTGGGSAGHVTPNLSLIPELTRTGWSVEYIGTKNGIERQMIGNSIPYHVISAGKLRRYFALKNFTDPFKVVKGVFDAYFILRRVKPGIIFSKGGFVSLPVSIAASALRIPVILHESDFTPGLANKLSLPFAAHICLTFPETLKYVPQAKATLTGNPTRKTILSGNKIEGRKICGFSPSTNKPTILVIGGSLGAVKINQVIRSGLKELLQKFQVIHICGQGNLDPSISVPGYCQFEFVTKELPDLFAVADLVVSRAGANVLFELLALEKPNLLIPLSAAASRGDQILNAESFAKQGFSAILHEENLTETELLGAILNLYKNKDTYIKAMKESQLIDATDKIIRLIEQLNK